MRLFLIILTTLLAAERAVALAPDELLLITNRNMPEGRALAELYAAERGVPGGRILEIPLPITEEVAPEQYDEQIAPAVRAFLEEHHLRGQVKCLVTFYGMPLRLRQRPFTAAEQAELADLQAQVGQIQQQIQGIVASLEAAVAATVPEADAPAPAAAPNADVLARRADAAFKALERALPDLDDERRQELTSLMLQVMEQLAGPAAIVERVRANGPADSDEAIRLRALRERVQAAAAGAANLQGEQHDPEARQRLRAIVRENFGLIAYGRLINSQLQILNPTQTTAALDSELALLWWEDYPRARWLTNPLYFRAPVGVRRPPLLMVARLDAPTPQIVRRMILDAVAAEREGLAGRLLVDAGGSLTLGAKGARPDEYGKWDDYLKALAHFAQAKTKLPVVLDEAAAVVQPAERTDEVALYAGWYSVRKYVPGLVPSRGAVGLHYASFEAVSLRTANEQGWVAGLLRDGAAATIGPVAEPYLQTFPRPDELFPLLMTGRLTLAEAYWRTAPTVSWMMVLFGDPLYRPYAVNPVLDVGDLPVPLQRIVESRD